MAKDSAQTLGTSWARVFALVAGGVYLVLGVAGFVFGSHGALGIFGAGPLLNSLRVALGLVGVAMGSRASSPQTFGWLLFAALTGLTVFGVLVTATGQVTDVNHVLRIQWADNWLHGISALLGLLVVLGFTRRSRQERRSDT